jgi:hypothetical protein
MATEHTTVDDVVYDLISVIYHALQGAETEDKYIQDAHEHEDVRQFFEEVARQDGERARRGHELLLKLTAGAGGR